MTTTATPSKNGTQTDRKPRIRKPQTAEHFMTGIKGQPLKVKVDLLASLKTSIEEDRKALQEQLGLIEHVK